MTSNTTPSAEAAPSTPDPIQAAAMECANVILAHGYSGRFGDSVKMITERHMRELVAREQLKDIHAVADLREDNARLRERVAGLEGEVKYRGEMSDSWRKSYESLFAEMVSINIQLAAARRDAERLDWLDKNSADWWQDEDEHGYFVGCDPSKVFSGPTFRAAIDAAMKEDGK
jgi:hypothetical protein